MWPQKSLVPVVIIVRQTVYLMLSVIWVRQEYFWLYLGKTFHFMIRDVEVAKKYFHSQRINHSKATCTKSQLTNVFLFCTIGVTVLMRSNFDFLHTVFPWIVSEETILFWVFEMKKIQIVAANFNFLPNKLNFCCGNYSRK